MIDYIKKYFLLLILIIIAFVAYMGTIMPSGFPSYCFDNWGCGINYWGAHAHDAIWHLAIVAVSFQEFPFIAPTFSGAQLSGYNYFLDIIIFLLTKIGIPAAITYFKILPIVWFVLFTTLVLQFGRKLYNSRLFIGVLLFFMYFAGSFSYIITWLKDKTMWGSSAVLAMQPLLSLTNVQFAFSLCVLLYILILIKEDSQDLRSSFFLSLLVALNIALKFYGGVISIFLVGMYFLVVFVKQKNIRLFSKQLILLVVTSTISVILFYNPFAPTTPGAVLTFKPFATVHQLIEDPNLLYMKDMVNARYFLEQSGKFSPRLIWIELQTLALFLILNFGSRIIGIAYVALKAYKRQFSHFDLLLSATIIFSMFLNIFFVQKGQWWNTVQFSYYAFFLANIFAALAIFELIRKLQKSAILSIVVLVVLGIVTIPTSLDVVKTFNEFPAHAYLPSNEESALKFLEKRPNGIVFTPLPDKKKHNTNRPVPLSSMYDSAYIAAYSGKQMYIADEVQLQLTGVDYQERANKSMDWNCEIVKDVNYLYELIGNPIGKKLDSCKENITKIYQTDGVTIYQVSQGQLQTR